MTSIWNKTVSRYVDVNDDWTEVTWETREPVPGQYVRVEAANNGYVIAHEDSMWIERSLYDVQSRLEKLLEVTINHSRPFDASEYDYTVLERANYVFTESA